MNELIVAVPCVNVQETTVEDWLNKLDEEVAEFKAEILRCYKPGDVLIAGKLALHDKERAAEEGADVCTVVTSINERMGIVKAERMQAQLKVNRHNHERGRF